MSRDNSEAFLFMYFIGEGAKSTAVTLNPFWLNIIASYPCPHPSMHISAGFSFFAISTKKGVGPPRSHPVSPSIYIFSHS